MATYEVTGPDGKIFQVDTPPGATEQEAIAYVKRRYYQPKEQAGFIQSFKETATGLKAAPAAARFGAAETGDAEARQRLIAAQESPTAKTAFQDIEDIPSAIDWARQTAGSSMGYLAAPAVAGGAGAIAQGLLKSPAPIAKVAGLGTLGAQYLVENLGRQAGSQEQAAQEGRPLEPTSVSKAALGAAGQTTLDVVGFKFFQPLFSRFPVLGKLLGKEGEGATKEAEDQLIQAFRSGNLKRRNGVLTGMGRGIAFEVPQEIGQQMLERWQAGLPLADEEARNEYYESAAGAVLLGGGLGGANTFMQNRAKRQQAQSIIDQQDAARKALLAEEAKKRAEARAAAADKTQADLDKPPVAPVTPATPATPVTPATLATPVVPTAVDPLASVQLLSKTGSRTLTAADLIAFAREKRKANGKAITKKSIEKKYNNGEPISNDQWSAITKLAAGTNGLFGTPFVNKFQKDNPMFKILAEEDILKGQEESYIEAQKKAGESQAAELGKNARPEDEIPFDGAPQNVQPSGITGVTPEEVVSDGSGSDTDRGSDAESVSPDTTAGPGIAAVGTTGVASPVAPVADTADGEGTVGPALDASNSYIGISERINTLKKHITNPALVEELAVLQDYLDENGKPQTVSRGKQATNKEAAVVRAEVTAKLENIIQRVREPIHQIDEQQRARDASNKAASALAQTEIKSEEIAPGEVEIERNAESESGNPFYALFQTLRQNKSVDAALQHMASKIKGDKTFITDLVRSSVTAPEAEVSDIERVKLQGQTKTGKAKTKTVKVKLTPEERAAKQDFVRSFSSKGNRVTYDLQRIMDRAAVDETLIGELSNLDFSDSKVEIEGEADANTKVFDRLKKENKLAEYDPKTNTFYFTKNGVTDSIVLHEVVHAATVKVIKQYLTDPSKLTLEQREAVEHLQKIMKVAQRKLSEKYPAAFENLYEFVSYGLTNKNMRADLAKLRAPSLQKYTAGQNLLNGLSTMWSQFTEALANMFGIYRQPKVSVEINKTGTTRKGISKPPFSKSVHETSPEGNVLLETAEAFSRILSTPEAGTDVAPLAATFTADATEVKTAAQWRAAELNREIEKQNKAKLVHTLNKKLTGVPGFNYLIQKFQNDRRYAKVWQDTLSMSGKLVEAGEALNNIYHQIVRSTQEAFNLVTSHLQVPMQAVNTAISDYAKAAGTTPQEVMATFHIWMTAIHEPERRATKYLLNVPLDNVYKWDAGLGNGQDTAAGHRNYILTELYKNEDKTAIAPKYREELKKIVFGTMPDGTKYARKGANTVSGVMVKHPKSIADPKTEWAQNYMTGEAMSANPNDHIYDVIGTISQEALADARREYNDEINRNDARSEALRSFMENFREVQRQTEELNRRANYWSRPVDNLVKFYGWNNYVTLKGRPDSQVTANDERLEIYSKRGAGGYEYIENPKGFQGRQFSESENVVMQTLAEGTKSAMRLARQKTTLAIRNSIMGNDDPKKGPTYQKNLLRGKLKSTIKFEDRYNSVGVNEDAIKGENNVFFYRPDGNIEVYQIDDNEVRESIRRSYREPQPLTQMANALTGFFGHMHTRYNPAFHPYNFVRDALTNSFNMGSSELGPGLAAENIRAVAARVAQGGIRKAWKISQFYANADIPGLNKMIFKDGNPKNQTPDNIKDQFGYDIYRWLELGGRSAYIQGLTAKGTYDMVLKNIAPTDLQRTQLAVNRFVDSYADMFEYTSRAASFAVIRDKLVAEGVALEEAEARAVAFSKELANFEATGEYGRAAGALYMFFRPAATGAVRALDSIAPMFQDVDTMVKHLPDVIKNDPEAVAKYRSTFIKQQEAATTMVGSLIGAGVMLYMMAWMMSDDDELGRNRVATDDMAQWTRNLRIPLGMLGGDDNKYLQLPWGFGLGAFMSIGAQLAGMTQSNTSFLDSAGNMANVALDSFLPLPISRISPVQNPVLFIMDSISPSVARPVLEFTWNTDGLGRKIYGDRTSRYGDAFSGVGSSSEMFSGAARLLARITNAEIDVSPTTLAFWTNNYLDGVTKVLQNFTGLWMVLTGDKKLDVKKDIPAVSSFVGRKSDVDAREFARIEEQLVEKQKKLNMLKNRTDEPELIQQYLRRHPNDPILVYMFNQYTAMLRPYREARNQIQALTYIQDPETGETRRITSKERKAYLDKLKLDQNILKQRMIERFQQFNVTPN